MHDRRLPDQRSVTLQQFRSSYRGSLIVRRDPRHVPWVGICCHKVGRWLSDLIVAAFLFSRLSCFGLMRDWISLSLTYSVLHIQFPVYKLPSAIVKKGKTDIRHRGGSEDGRIARCNYSAVKQGELQRLWWLCCLNGSKYMLNLTCAGSSRLTCKLNARFLLSTVVLLRSVRPGATLTPGSAICYRLISRGCWTLLVAVFNSGRKWW